jgi:hypothetical protein
MTAFVPISLFLGITLFWPLQQAEFTGDWYFDRFAEANGEVSHNPDIDKANQQEAGFKFTFTKDGKFKSIGPNGTHTTKDYQYLADSRQIIIDGDTLKIALLTSQVMELCPGSGKQAAMFLRRSKEVKTP